MKNLIIASAAAALLTTAGAAAAQERVVATTDLNVRAGPGTDYPVVGTIGANDIAVMRECTSNWCQIEYGGGNGWASSSYLAYAGAENRERDSGAGGAVAGTALGAVGGALVGGPVGAIVGGAAGGAIGATTDERDRNEGVAAGVATGAIGGALVGGPVGAIVGGAAGGVIGAGVDAQDERIDRSTTASTTPDFVPRSAYRMSDSPRTAVWYRGQYLEVETETGRVIGRLNY